MGIVEWAKSPWGQDVPIHIFWYLIWVSAIAGLAFLIVHAVWIRYFAKPEEFADSPVPVKPSRNRWLASRATSSASRPASASTWSRPNAGA